MKSLVVMTYYQLMHSIALALTFNEKPILYFSMSYIDADDDFIERIKDSGVFKDVLGITKRGEHAEFLKKLRKTRDASERTIHKLGASLFEEYLEPHYAELFKDSDFEEEIYVYNDFQWHFYFISKHFKKIIGVEDGYSSLVQQLSVHRLRGDAELVNPFIELGYYPEPLYKHHNIQKIISSTDFEDQLDEYYRGKLEVWDFKDIVELNRDKFKQALLYIFETDKIKIEDDSTLYLGQPLDRAMYCSYLENYLLTKKIIRKEIEKGHKVYYKPHPAERNDIRIYQNEGVQILQKNFPVEALNYQDKKFSRMITFSSTGASLINCAEEEIKIYDKIDTNPDEVKQFIKQQVKDEQIVVDLYFLIRKMTPEIFIHAYSSVFRHENVVTNIHFVIPEKKYKLFSKYYDMSNLKERIKEYKDRKKKQKDRDIWYLELKQLPEWVENYHANTAFHSVTSLDERIVLDEVISKSRDYDYAMLLEPMKTFFYLTERIYESFNALMFSAIYFENYTYVKDKKNKKKKISLKPGYVDNSYDGGIQNVFMHRVIVETIAKGDCSEINVSGVINDYLGSICRKQGETLYVAPKKYTQIIDGDEYFGKKMEQLKEMYPEEEDRNYLVGQMANTLYDYFNWYMVIGLIDDPRGATEKIEELIGDQELEREVLRKMINAFFYEKALSDRNPFFQKREYYMGIKKAIDVAARKGWLKIAARMKR